MVAGAAKSIPAHAITPRPLPHSTRNRSNTLGATTDTLGNPPIDYSLQDSILIYAKKLHRVRHFQESLDTLLTKVKKKH